MDAKQQMFNEVLNGLVQAAGRFSMVATLAYKAGDPAAYQAMKGLFDKGLGELGLSLQFTPRPFVEVYLAVDGERRVFFSLTGEPIGENAPRIN